MNTRYFVNIGKTIQRDRMGVWVPLVYTSEVPARIGANGRRVFAEQTRCERKNVTKAGA